MGYVINVVIPLGTLGITLNLENVMKKFSTLAAAAALALAAVAPVSAEEAKVNADPFVSTQGAFAIGTPGLIAAGLVVGVIAVAAIDSSDGTN